MCNERYHGWTNRETWLVNVWFNPETKSDVACARELLEDQVEEWSKDGHKNGIIGCLVDMLDLGSVNWEELERKCVEDERRATMTKLFDILERNIGKVRIKVWAEVENDLDLSWDDDGSVRAKLDSGEWVAYCAVVKVTHWASGLSDTAYLGGCIDAYDGTALKGYLRNMVSYCVADIRRQVSRTRNCKLKGAHS